MPFVRLEKLLDEQKKKRRMRETKRSTQKKWTELITDGVLGFWGAIRN